MAKRAVIFDLDGTLVDSLGDIATCANEVLSLLGLPSLPLELYRAYLGDGLVKLARRVLLQHEANEADVDRFVELFKSRYQTKWNLTTQVYNGIVELLSSLTDRGIPLAVLSNKRQEFTRACVEQLLPTVHFSAVRGECEGVPLKPEPTSALRIAEELGVTPAECVFVGDSEIDAETATRAGMMFVGVLWGFRTREQLERAGAQKLIMEPLELLPLLV